MRLLAKALFCLAILSTIPLSRATPVDPQISVGDPSSGTPLHSSTFFFTSDANGGGVLDFINDTGHVWQTLDFFVTLPAIDTITCSSTVYGSCGYTATTASDGQALFDIGFEQPLMSGGIVSGESFSINLTDPNQAAGANRGSWGPFTTIEGVANFGIPEPASWILTAIGLLVCALGAIYRRPA
jgi:hypothetical protein